MQQLHCKLQTMSSTHSVSTLSICGARLSMLRCDTRFVDRERAWGMAGGQSRRQYYCLACSYAPQLSRRKV